MIIEQEMSKGQLQYIKNSHVLLKALSEGHKQGVLHYKGVATRRGKKAYDLYLYICNPQFLLSKMVDYLKVHNIFVELYLLNMEIRKGFVCIKIGIKMVQG